MNKNIFKAVLLAAFALPVLSSCELDQEPETNITTKVRGVRAKTRTKMPASTTRA